MKNDPRHRALTPSERYSLRLLIRLARARKACRRLPPLHIPPHIARIAREQYGIDVSKN